ncbi:MAG: alpha-2-macroglobulin family protein [Proteobacteria bacterium]|nr:alpha-2-macroglobulin family protein [Pseudomonadota bacterium]
MLKLLARFPFWLLLVFIPALGVAASDDLVTLYGDTPLTVLDISERSYDGGNALAVTLSVPLDSRKKHDSYLNVSMKGQGKVDGAWVLAESGKTLYFPFIEPDRDYTVTVYRGLTAITRAQLGKTESATMHSRNVTATVSFGGSGVILPPGNAKGLPVVTVNVDEVTIEFHRVDDISRFLLSWGNSQSKNTWELNELAKQGQLVYTGRFSLAPPKNKRRTVNIPVQDVKELKKPGIYMAVLKEAGKYPSAFKTAYFMISDIGLHVRLYQRQMDVYAASLAQAEPLAKVAMTLYDSKGKILQETVTSPQGVATFQAPFPNAQVIVAKKGQHISILELGSPALDLSDFSLGKRPFHQIEAFLYGPRDIYRPGETMELNMLLRSGDGEMLPDFPVPVEIKRPDGQLATEFLWQTEGTPGYFHHRYQIPASAPTGKWQVAVAVAGKKERRFYDFKVEDFLPERMTLVFDDGTKKTRFTQAAESLKVPVAGDYLYGAPASGNRLSVAVAYQQDRFPLEMLKGFEFGDHSEFADWSRFELDDVNLDAEGKVLLDIPSRWQQSHSPLVVRVDGSLYESGGRPVTRSVSYTVWPHDVLIGVRPLFEKDGLENNTLASFEVVAARKDGELVAARDLEVKLIRDDRDYYWLFDEYGGWQPRYNQKAYTAFAVPLQIKKGAKEKVSFPVENGHYRLEIRDPKTGAITSTAFHVGYSWWWYSTGGDNAPRPDAVSLVLDKKKYQPGDLATLTIKSPHAGKGFVLVESDEPLWFAPLEVGTNGTATMKIPVGSNWNRHDIYISALVLRPVDSTNKVTVNRAMGLTPLPLDRSGRRLELTVTAPEKIRPEKELAVDLKVQGAPGPGPIMVTLAAVDVGVLNVTDFATPDPFTWFYEQRRFGVDSRDNFGKVIEAMDGSIASLRFGGDADVSRGGKNPMTEVQIVSLFSGPVALSAEGHAQVKLDIPNFNGRLRLMALAFAGNRFGNGETETTVAAPLVAEISLPRFLAPGDRSQATLDVRNMTAVAQQLSWQLTATSPLTLENGKDQATLLATEKVSRIYPLAAPDFGLQSEIKVHLGNQAAAGEEEIEINRSWKLGLRPAYPASERRQQAMLKNGETFTLEPNLLKGLIPSTVEVEFALSNTPPLGLHEHLSYLLHYPYGCLEQTISSSYPFLFIDDNAMQMLGMKSKDWPKHKRIEALDRGVQLLAAKQQTPGGFGLWSNTGPEEHYLTVFAAHFLLQAREKGVTVPPQMFDNAFRRLEKYVEGGANFGVRYSDDEDHYRLAYRAYAGYVLSLVNRAPLGSLRTLYDNHLGDAKSGLPLIHLGLALQRMGDSKRGIAAVTKGLTLTRDAKKYLGDYGSPIRDLALTISLLQKHELLADQAGMLLFGLADLIHSRGYLSTQERLALLQVGLPLLEAKGQEWQGRLQMGSESRQLSGKQSYRQVLSGEVAGQGLHFASTSNQPLYGRILVSGYPLTRPEPVAEKLRIERFIYDMQGKEMDLDQVRTGDLLLVQLVVVAEERVPDLLVVDLIPAGLELENQNLLHGVKLDELMLDGTSVASLLVRRQLKHEEFRDDRYVAALDQPGHDKTHLFYLARAVTPGTYTVPPPLAEDMYRPDIRAVGKTPERLVVTAK